VSLTSLGWIATRGAAFGAAPTGDRLARMQSSSMFDGNTFVNPVATSVMVKGESAPMLDFFTKRAARRPDVAVPLETPDPAALAPTSGLRVTWMGHSSMLIEIDGHLVLTDPVWGPRASPFRWMGPQRFHEPPLPLDALPELDAILISHDHYDHLDLPTVLALKDRDVPWLVPLGVGAHLESWGVPAERITELEWWQEAPVGDLRLVSTPARHFSGRGLGDRNRTLWTSWAVIGPEHSAWFSGDTGPYDGFTEIPERLGHFDVAMVEIGAYHPSWGSIHLGPGEAAKVHRQVGADVLLPVHWGTFDLALHAWDDPIVELQALADAQGITLAVPVVGGQVEAATPAVHDFWRSRARLRQASALSVLTPELSGGSAR